MPGLALPWLAAPSAFAGLPVCVRYRLPDGSETEDFPGHQSDFHHAEPIYETLQGWEEPLEDAESLADLPAAARAYVAFVEERLGIEACLISVGAERERVVAPRGLASVAG